MQNPFETIQIISKQNEGFVCNKSLNKNPYVSDWKALEE